MSSVLILGATSDIANRLAHEYGRNGYNLYLAARDPDRLAESAKDLEIRYGVEVRPLPFEAIDYAGHAAFYEELDPKPVGVVCAVGYLGEQQKAQGDFGEAARIIETNLTGCISILNLVAADFERRRLGFIVGISSVAGDRGRRRNYLYGSAKAGFTAYLSGLRNRLFDHGVQVLTVKPGFVRTRMTEGMDLPPRLCAEPVEAAKTIFRAQQKGRDVVYVKWFWRFIMLAIIHLPERVFKKTDI